MQARKHKGARPASAQPRTHTHTSTQVRLHGMAQMSPHAKVASTLGEMRPGYPLQLSTQRRAGPG
eukprot:15447326-Alexandrium_andersonii.AAC.1